MRQPQTIIGALAIAALVGLGAAPARAAAPPATNGAVTAPPAAPARSAHASVRLDLGRAKAWVGQAIPITLSAQFRAVEGVTLEGLPQIKSDGIFTSDLARDPRQATQIVAGEPVLVATWTGTITPSTAGPLALSVELPVRIRFHDAAPAPAIREPEADEDPFQSMMNIDPSDPSSIQRVFQSMQHSFPMGLGEPTMGRAHDEALTLKATTHPLDVQPLPITDQPVTFAGAVGRFELHASLSAETAHPNEPLTLSVVLKGDGDLDRVELPGVVSTADWKAYPMSTKAEAAAPGKKLGHKAFEQVLVPTHGGQLIVPALELSAFDPVAGHYMTVTTAPLTVDVDGPTPTPVAQTAPASPAATISATSEDTPVSALPPPPPSALVDSPKAIALRLAPILTLLLGAALTRWGWQRDPERSLHRALRRSAKQGSIAAFFDAARRLIVVHFSKRWGVSESEVTAEALRAQLGPRAEPLVNAIATSDALRFGRRNLQPIELGALCSSIEESLRNAA